MNTPYQTRLDGKKVQLLYKENERQRKWRKGFISLCYTSIAHCNGINLMKQENWHAIKFVDLQSTEIDQNLAA